MATKKTQPAEVKGPESKMIWDGRSALPRGGIAGLAEAQEYKKPKPLAKAKKQPPPKRSEPVKVRLYGAGAMTSEELLRGSSDVPGLYGKYLRSALRKLQGFEQQEGKSRDATLAVSDTLCQKIVGLESKLKETEEQLKAVTSANQNNGRLVIESGNATADLLRQIERMRSEFHRVEREGKAFAVEIAAAMVKAVAQSGAGTIQLSTVDPFKAPRHMDNSLNVSEKRNTEECGATMADKREALKGVRV